MRLDNFFDRLGIAALVLVCLSNSALAAPDAVLLTLSGKVDVERVGAQSWTPGTTNDSLKVGDRLRTGRSSRASLRLSNLSLLRVFELTTLEIQPPQQAGGHAMLDLQKGAAYFFNRDKPLETQFRTPTASGAIRGTEFNLAVGDDGHTELALLNGEVDITNAQGGVQLHSGEKAEVKPGQAPTKSPLINAVDVIQWTLYYPIVLDPDELESKYGEKDSLDAYGSGDLLGALAAFLEPYAPTGSLRVYRAALELSVGKVDDAEEGLKNVPAGTRNAALADALREMIASVKGQPWHSSTAPTLATEYMAASYQAQAQHHLDEALALARKAAAKSPNFGAARERVAEMEFSFGHTGAALAALNKALALSPRNGQALALNGFALSAQNRIAAARKYFDRAIAVDGALANGWLGRGLVRIRTGEVNEGRQDLETAAALEPNRAFLRSYLGKAWALDQPFQYSWNLHLATNELHRAMDLDPNDPTSWLYSALLNDQRNCINQAIHELEHSEALNNNQAVYRSKFLLDQDQAVRSANLAVIYQDASMTDVAVREATKSVEDDYANFSAHLFLSESYDALQDPTKENLRYQTPEEDELLVANLLSPVGAGALSQNIAQQDYSKLFTADRLGVSSQTQFYSRGAWLENASQFGTVEDLSYSLDAYYYTDPGWRPNNDVQNSDIDAKIKYQVTAHDTVFFQVERTELDAGDVFEHYNYNTPEVAFGNGSHPGYDPTLHEQEIQDPNILVGYHRDWGTGNHTVILYRNLQDSFTANDGEYIAPLLVSPGGGTPALIPLSAPVVTEMQRTLDLNSLEIQHIYESDLQNIIVGGRYQNEGLQVQSSTASSQALTLPPPNVPSVDANFQRLSFYGYYQLRLLDQVNLTGGATYDWERYPLNITEIPLSAQEAERSRISPKAGVDWTLPEGTRLRADYTRSMGGLLNDSSTTIEPTEIGGFNQAFRSLVPESSGFGTPPATQFETWGIGADHKFPTGTYLDIEGQWLNSHGDQLIGAWAGGLPVPQTIADLMQYQSFHEKDAFASVYQLIGSDLGIGARYSLISAELSTELGIPAGVANASTYNLHENSTLNEVSLFANYYLPCGFFSQLQANWWSQDNITAGEPGDDFWQLNVYAGYRFPRRHIEVQVGVLNLLNQDYHIDPVTYFLEQAHNRQVFASLKFTF